MRKRAQRKVLVILPPDDVRRIEDRILEGKYVTKSDFFRIAVKELLYREKGREEFWAKDRPLLEEGQVLDSKQVLSVLKANKTKIGDFGAKEIGLFGSYVSAEQTPESDIDILVEFSKGKKSFHNYMQLKLFLEKIFKKKVDLVIKDAVRPELKQQILKGVVYA
jgi:hypothetical protein